MQNNSDDDADHEDDPLREPNAAPAKPDLTAWMKFKSDSYREKMAIARAEAAAEAFADRKKIQSHQIAKNIVSNLHYSHYIADEAAEKITEILQIELFKNWDILDLQDHDLITTDLTATCRAFLKAYNCLSACWYGVWDYVYDFAELENGVKNYIKQYEEQNPILSAAPKVESPP